MAVTLLKGCEFKTIDNTTGTIPEGFIMASFNNVGDADATIVQNGKTGVLPSKEVFEMPVLPGYFAYYSAAINATGTKVYCTYIM
jgi:hypothetical protein